MQHVLVRRNIDIEVRPQKRQSMLGQRIRHAGRAGSGPEDGDGDLDLARAELVLPILSRLLGTVAVLPALGLAALTILVIRPLTITLVFS